MSDHTPLQDLLMRMKAAFPEAVTEEQRHDDDGKSYYAYALKEDFVEQLRDMGPNTLDDSNRYELQFPGKRAAKAQVFSPSYKTLVADKAESKSFDDTGNLFIEGDNLDVLRLLQNSYRGKIKMIYIDPPYNTGSDGFIYEDDFSVLQKQYLQDIGVLDEEGVRQISELQDGLQGKFHSGWLAMMYPRLKLARDLLAKDGTIFISIDDNEQANLKLVCDEIFGEDNNIGNICWNSTKSVTNKALLSVSHNNIYVYAKNIDYFVENRSEFRLKENGKGFANPDNDPRGPWKADPFQVGGWRPNQQYEIKNPQTGEIFTPNEGCSWKNDYDKFQVLINDNRIVFGVSGESGPQRKRFLSEAMERGKVAKTWWDDVGTTSNGTTELKEIFDGKSLFSNPKPVSLITKIIQLGCPRDGIIMDFFAGSGTTGEAVMRQNKEDGGDRKFILVQRGEEIKKEHVAHDFCREELNRPAKISEIAKERLRRAGDKILEGGATVDIGFRVFTTTESLLMSNDDKPFSESEKSELSLYKRDLSVDNFDSLINEALLHTGVTLDLPIAVHKAGKGYPYAIVDRCCYCITKDLTQDIVHKIMEQHGEDFDILYYLSDCPAPTTSYTELESVIRLTGDEKKIKTLNFY